MIAFKPMLAATLDSIAAVPLPCYASAKIDGIRAILMPSPRTGNRVLFSRSLKPIPNLHIRHTIEASTLPNGLDGELTVGLSFNNTASGIMSIDGEPEFHYWCFDYLKEHHVKAYWRTRWQIMQDELREYEARYPWFHILTQTRCETLAEVQHIYNAAMLMEQEGIMIKHPDMVYVFGRAQRALMKVKPFRDAEATVIGFTELQHNDNDKETNELGYAERSSAQASLIAGDTLGALIVRGNGLQFKIGTGFTAEQRREIWHNKERFRGKTLTYKYQEHGMKDKPRMPVFLRWKEEV